jgi:hypothetical protein
MTRRQAYFAFTTISFVGVMYFVGKIITWGLEKWDWWFWGFAMVGLFILGFLIEYVERRNRRHDPID